MTPGSPSSPPRPPAGGASGHRSPPGDPGGRPGHELPGSSSTPGRMYSAWTCTRPGWARRSRPWPPSCSPAPVRCARPCTSMSPPAEPSLIQKHPPVPARHRGSLCSDRLEEAEALTGWKGCPLQGDGAAQHLKQLCGEPKSCRAPRCGGRLRTSWERSYPPRPRSW